MCAFSWIFLWVTLPKVWPQKPQKVLMASLWRMTASCSLWWLSSWNFLTWTSLKMRPQCLQSIRLGSSLLLVGSLLHADP